MLKSTLSLFLGLTATATVLTPMTVKAATFDYNRVKNWTVRPIDSKSINVWSFKYGFVYNTTKGKAGRV